MSLVKCGESLCFIDVTECLCRGPRRLVYSPEEFFQFVSNMLLLGVRLDVFELGLRVLN